MRTTKEFDFIVSHLQWLTNEFNSLPSDRQGQWEDPREILNHFSSVLGNAIFKLENKFENDELMLLRECYTMFLQEANMGVVLSKISKWKNYDYTKNN